MTLYLTTWKEKAITSSNKWTDKAQIVDVVTKENAISGMTQFNAKSAATTTDYNAYNLDELFIKKKMRVVSTDEVKVPEIETPPLVEAVADVELEEEDTEEVTQTSS